ncbi:hypothetical protein PTI98_002141 [Pleurotus ostreatus]|nr:hypothetical protein PTI98_002141 [Pleurotus ostreatus]
MACLEARTPAFPHQTHAPHPQLLCACQSLEYLTIDIVQDANGGAPDTIPPDVIPRMRGVYCEFLYFCILAGRSIEYINIPPFDDLQWRRPGRARGAHGCRTLAVRPWTNKITIDDVHSSVVEKPKMTWTAHSSA